MLGRQLGSIKARNGQGPEIHHRQFFAIAMAASERLSRCSRNLGKICLLFRDTPEFFAIFFILFADRQKRLPRTQASFGSTEVSSHSAAVPLSRIEQNSKSA